MFNRKAWRKCYVFLNVWLKRGVQLDRYTSPIYSILEHKSSYTNLPNNPEGLLKQTGYLLTSRGTTASKYHSLLVTLSSNYTTTTLPLSHHALSCYHVSHTLLTLSPLSSTHHFLQSLLPLSLPLSLRIYLLLNPTITHTHTHIQPSGATRKVPNLSLIEVACADSACLRRPTPWPGTRTKLAHHLLP